VRRKVSRREFLRQAGAATILAAGIPWGKRGDAATLDDTGLTFNCMGGDVSSTGALVCLRAEKEGVVSIRYGKDPALKEFVATPPVRVAPDSDFTARIISIVSSRRALIFIRLLWKEKSPVLSGG